MTSVVLLQWSLFIRQLLGGFGGDTVATPLFECVGVRMTAFATTGWLYWKYTSVRTVIATAWATGAQWDRPVANMLVLSYRKRQGPISGSTLAIGVSGQSPT